MQLASNCIRIMQDSMLHTWHFRRSANWDGRGRHNSLAMPIQHYQISICLEACTGEKQFQENNELIAGEELYKRAFKSSKQRRLQCSEANGSYIEGHSE
ncbi:hypothetical protein AVEN_218686-1 [Araneus ventricosus]|uniref:Uncharacterized protein n=1 Tax=Araneus ventricosus TaxID=182803 RepID=A0A4Y2B7B7_ARAVE|nr:hypothetical protein AVEN_218686-1 [Araneus ventricosus]